LSENHNPLVSASDAVGRKIAVLVIIKQEGKVPKDTYHSKFLSWGIWVTGLATAGFMVADIVIRPPLAWLSLMPCYCLAAFVLLHSLTVLGPRRALWLLVLGLVLPFVAEYLGTNFGAIFGSHWFARARDLRIPVGLMLPGRVPLTTVLSWYGHLYLVFLISVYLVQVRPSDVSAFAAAPLTAALLIALWQLTAGPVAVGRGQLGFANNGFYHGIPLASFAGWFATTLFILLFYQIVEPRAADADRFREPDQRIAPLAFVMFGVTLLYPTLLCFRLNFTGAGWLGIAVFLLYVLALAIRLTRPALAHLGTAPSSVS